MKRFYFGEEENYEDEDEFDSDSEPHMFPDPADFITMAQFENPDNFILNSSIKICEKSLFWNFFGVSKKIKMISKVFESLKKLTEGNKDA